MQLPPLAAVAVVVVVAEGESPVDDADDATRAKIATTAADA